jgi:hypothetical protein
VLVKSRACRTATTVAASVHNAASVKTGVVTFGRTANT